MTIYNNSMIKERLRKHTLWGKADTDKRRFLDIHVTDHCDLNCKCCAHFSPVAQPFCIGMDELKDQYVLLEPVFDQFFNSIHLMGGEPLLHPHLDEIIAITRRYFPKAEIQLITNGILLPRADDSFWEQCRQSDVHIEMTGYPIGLDHEAIKKKAKTEKVKFRIAMYADTFIHHYLDPSGKQDPRESRAKCKFGGECLQLRNGNIYPCAQAAYADILNQAFGVNFEKREGDYIRLGKNFSKVELDKLTSEPIPFCRYCDLGQEHYVEWGLSGKAREEWI